MKFPLMKNNILREDLDQVIKHLQQDDPILTNNIKVREFEDAWSNWLGVKYSVFVNSGASANLVTIAALKILYPNGGKIIVPSFTWSSDIYSIMYMGFEPVFVDINMKNLAMSTEDILNLLAPDVVAVFLSHILGFNGLSKKLIQTLEAKKIHLIEDVCESHGARFNGQKVGTFGLASNFSFYYAHHMSTIEGGMISTNSEELYQILRMLRSHGLVRESSSDKIKQHYKKEHPDLNSEFIFAYPAFNVRNTEIGGILGLSQIKRLDFNIQRRNENFNFFLEHINKTKFFTAYDLDGMSNYALSLILNEKDDVYAQRLVKKLTSCGIEFRRGSAGGGNHLRQPYLKNLYPRGYHEKFEVTEHMHFFGFYLGNYPELNFHDIEFICKKINNV